MKLITENDRVVAAATDEYPGGVAAPEGFDPARMSEYRVTDGVVEIPGVPLVEAITIATQNRLDDFARTRNYDGILSACTYASSQIPKFAAEGQRCVDARDSTWATLYTIMGEVQVGTRPMPASFADVEPDLPVLEWPA